MGSKSSPLRAGACARSGSRRISNTGAATFGQSFARRTCSAIVVFIASLLAPGLAGALPTDCIGDAPDGLAKCTAPLVSGYTYNLCSSSLLYVAEAAEQRCYASTVGTGPITQESTLQALMTCMGGQGGPSWMSTGSANGFFCSGTVTYKYGTEVVGISQTVPYSYGNLQPTRYKTAVCPYGYNPVGGTSSLPDKCVQVPKCCGDTTPNPMGIANGDHSLVETDISPSAASPLEFTRYYSSSAYYRPVNAFSPQTVAYPAIAALNLNSGLMPGFGDYWRHTYDRKIVLESATYAVATALRPDGVNKHFRLDGNSVINEDRRADTLVSTKDAQGNITGWIYTTDEAVEYYAATGELWSISTRSGRTLTMVYSVAGGAQIAGLLLEVDDDVGHFLKFTYDDKYRLTSVTDTAGNVFGYAYSGDVMLASVTFPGGASRTYLYNENPLGRNGGPYGMTGLIDEFGTRIATYGYATGSMQAYTEHTGGTDHYERAVVDSTHVTVTDPLGTTRTHTLQQIAGASRIVAQSQPAGFGSAASTSSRTYDAVGNVASVDDFDGRRTCMVNDPVRLLETTRVEGLANTAACSTVTAAGASLPTGSRKISTQWHPDWRLQSRKAEPGRITTYVYNGQADPTAGNAIANCAPTTALLPGGKPIAVLCAKVEQATLDANGSQGLTAGLDSSVAVRRWSYSYNGRGQILTSTDPRNNASTSAYYAATTTSATVGDLQSVTNAAGHVTTFDVYDKNGLVLQSTDPNGTVRTSTYDPRKRPTSVAISAGGVIQSTTYTYNASGDLTQVTLPDGKIIVSTYDTAHRLIGMTDPAGNTVTYTLDDAGNRVVEQVKDASGTLARNVARAFDALNRAYSVMGVAP